MEFIESLKAARRMAKAEAEKREQRIAELHSRGMQDAASRNQERIDLCRRLMADIDLLLDGAQ